MRKNMKSASASAILAEVLVGEFTSMKSFCDEVRIENDRLKKMRENDQAFFETQKALLNNDIAIALGKIERLERDLDSAISICESFVATIHPFRVRRGKAGGWFIDEKYLDETVNHLPSPSDPRSK